MNVNNKKVISLGLGVNSVAMTILLYNRGHRYPIVFADTGNENPKTYLYLEYFRKYLYLKFNTGITVLKPPSKFYVKRIRDTKSTSISDFCFKKGIIPFLGFRWCTGDFKIDPVHRFTRHLGLKINLIAISTEEAHRAKENKRDKIINEWSLLEYNIDRDGCYDIIKKEGFEVPLKSGCIFCPYQKKEQWRFLLKKYPGLFDMAIEMENNASRKIGKNVTLRAGCLSLEELKLLIEQENPLFEELFDYSRMDCYRCHL